MINRYPAWKNILVILVTAIGLFFALPNIYGEDPAVQVSATSGTAVGADATGRIKQALTKADVPYKSLETDNGRALVRFASTDTQLKAVDLVKSALGENYSVALNLAPRTPEWMKSIGLKPMTKGLDLIGGVHFLLQVDTKAAVDQAMSGYQDEIRGMLREKRIRYTDVAKDGDAIRAVFRNADDKAGARDLLSRQLADLTLTEAESASKPTLIARPTEQRLRDIKDTAVEQNIQALRRRVNDIGVAEPVVVRQGTDRVVVELPGLQDTAEAKAKLGGTSTLEFHLVDTNASPVQAEQSGHVPLGDKLYKDKAGSPVILKRSVIVTGEHITDAKSGIDPQGGGPDVNVTLDSAGGERMGRTTRENLNKPMAVVLIETKADIKTVNGKKIIAHHKTETVINVATIRGIFSSRFQVTGLTRQEAQNLAFALRTPLAAPVDIVEERTVGPSLGQQNIDQGFRAVLLGFLLVVGFMAVYYKIFGVIADLALLMNVVLIVALLSLIQATLTLPGIAGILLTVGMAVDANVLIYERIREELRNGNTPQASIHAGYERAFATIADANITTLIAALVLFMFGTGPVKGFAVTLSLGIVTSMFTAIMGTRAIVNGLYGGRRISHLPV